MTEIFIQDISVEDVAVSKVYGSTNRRRVRVYVTGTGTAAYTLNLATYIPGFAQIEGIDYATGDNKDSADSGSATWSTSTLTFATTGSYKYSIVGYMG